MKLNAVVFWILTGLIVLLVVATAAATTLHLGSVVRASNSVPAVDLSRFETAYESIINSPTLPSYERMQLYQAAADVKLNAYAAQQRYQQAQLLVATRTWLRYSGMLLGCLLMTIGLIYAMVQLRKYDSTLEADSQLVKLKFASASPGLMLVTLGTLLVVVAIISNPPITMTETTAQGAQSAVAQ